MKEKNFEEISDVKITEPKLRQIIIETDGNNINLIKSEVAGSLELRAILVAILEKIK